MKLQVLIWQIIALVVAGAFLFLLHQHITHKSEILSRTNNADCQIKVFSTFEERDLRSKFQNLCESIEDFK